MRKLSVTVFALALAALTAAHPARAQNAGDLDGWRQFKFGMSIDQARALPPPGRPWDDMPPNLKPRDMSFSKISTLISNGPIKEFGSDFDSVGLGFTAGEGLDNILMIAKKNESAEDCKKSFQMLLTALEARYGRFAPGYRAVAGADVRGLPGAKSRYQYAAGTVFDVGFWADARRVVGEKYVAVSTTHNTGGACLTMLFLAPHNLVAANAPVYRRSDGSYGRPSE